MILNSALVFDCQIYYCLKGCAGSPIEGQVGQIKDSQVGRGNDVRKNQMYFFFFLHGTFYLWRQFNTVTESWFMLLGLFQMIKEKKGLSDVIGMILWVYMITSKTHKIACPTVLMKQLDCQFACLTIQHAMFLSCVVCGVMSHYTDFHGP